MSKECSMDFYHRGRRDCLARLPANPNSAGAQNPKDFNSYMNGYNSVQETKYTEAVEDIVKLVKRHRAKSSKDGLVGVLVDTLIESLKEPADRQTQTDKDFLEYLDTLELFKEYELKKGFVDLYNAVQKSKRFHLTEGEITKQLRPNKK